MATEYTGYFKYKDANGNISILKPKTNVDVDTVLSITSKNPVENAVITTALNNKANSTHSHDLTSSNIDGVLPISKGGTGTASKPTLVSMLADNGVVTQGGITTTTTSGGTAGINYSAEVPGITALTNGVSFVMIPHVTSASRSPTLNVNDLGTVIIYRRVSGSTSTAGGGYNTNWLFKNIPIRMTYDATYSRWFAEGIAMPYAYDLMGTVPVGSGGTGVTSESDLVSMLSNNGVVTQGGITTTTPSWGTDGCDYAATVPGITSLTAGISFIMIPHVTSTTNTPTLSVNDLEDKIFMRMSSMNSGSVRSLTNLTLSKGIPIRVIYNGTYWIPENFNFPTATDIIGTVPISSGGTGTTNGSSVVRFGTCDTAAGTAAKTVTFSGFSLVTGAMIMVKFTYDNTASSPTLNVNSTGAKSIVTLGTTAAYGSSSGAPTWNAGAALLFVYDGTSWIMVGSGIGQFGGSIRVKNSTNYGCMISMGDGDYIHFSEPSDDCLEIKAKKVNFVTSDTSTTGLTWNSNAIGGSSSVTVDSALSSSSTNPVQNSVIYSALSSTLVEPTVYTTSSISSGCYTLTVSGITELVDGLSLLVKFHSNFTRSSSTYASVNLNSLGKIYISITKNYYGGAVTIDNGPSSISSTKTYRITYMQITNSWYMEEYTKAFTEDSSGTLSIANGGTGENTEYGLVSMLASNGVLTQGGIKTTTTSDGTDGTNYSAEVPGITALTWGVSFVMIPHVTSTSTTPTLNVNGLGAKTIKRLMSSGTFGTNAPTAGGTSGWLRLNIPIRVMYSNGEWIVQNITKPVATDLSGTVSVSNGGTGKSASSFSALCKLIYDQLVSDGYLT